MYFFCTFLNLSYESVWGKKERKEIKEKRISAVIIENCLLFLRFSKREGYSSNEASLKSTNPLITNAKNKTLDPPHTHLYPP